MKFYNFPLLVLLSGAVALEGLGQSKPDSHSVANAAPLDSSLQGGKTIYDQHCAACHGINGGGNGPAMVWLFPKPLNFNAGLFKIQSTPAGTLPTEDDLFNTVTRGMSACVGQIRLHGLVQLNSDGTWKENRAHPLYYLVHVAKVALPLYPQFGTEPNGCYIPPRWVPRPYLKQMFGPGVDRAIERYANPERELLAVLQLFGKDSRICFRYEIKEGPKIFETEIRGKKFQVYNDTVIGYSKDGQKIIETTVEEPIHVRPDKHANSI